MTLVGTRSYPSVLRLVGLSVILALCVLTALALSLPGAFLTLFVLAISLARQLLQRNSSNQSKGLEYLIFGFITPFASAFGSGTLLLSSVFLLFPDRLFRASLWAKWALPLYFPAACWVFAYWIVQFDPVLVSTYFSACSSCSWQESLSLFAFYLKSAPPVFYLASISLLRLLVMLALIRAFSECSSRRLSFFRGILLGLPVPLFALGMQMFAPEAQLFINQSAYWSSLNRLCASFTDPNAFGLFAFLTAGLVLGLVFTSDGARLLNQVEQHLAVVCGALFIAIGPFSGSRSYFLGLGLLSGAYLFSKSRKIALAFLIFCFTALLFFSTSAGEALVTVLQGLEWLPEGARRIVSAMQLSAIAETLFSRMVFLRIGIAVWLDHMLVGVGFGGFSSLVVPYADFLTIPTGTWSDNANNYYLSILAELGVIGVLGLLLTLLRLHRKPEATWWHFVTILCFGILLFFGPHLDFDEVAVLFAGLVGSAFSVSSLKIRFATLVPAMSLAAMVIVVAASEQSYGFYPWEREGNHFFRWTTGRSAGYQRCDADQKARVRFQVVHPNIASQPIRLGFTASGKQSRSYVITQYNKGQPAFTATAEFDCRDLPKSLAHLKGLPGIFWRMQVSPLWIPGRMLKGTRDPRALGIRVFSNTPQEVLLSAMGSEEVKTFH